MGIAVRNIVRRFLTLIVLLITVTTIQGEDGGVLDRKIKLTKNKGTVYELLKDVSDKSGYLFVYDSQIIDNDRKIKIKKGEYTLREAIYAITNNRKLIISVIDSHILLRIPEKNVEGPRIEYRDADTIASGPKHFTIGGQLTDRLSNEPIVYGSVSINNTSIGTVSNQNGEFKLVVPDSLSRSIVKFSHIGYESQEITALSLSGQNFQLLLNPQIVPLQEIVIRVVDPKQAIRDMIEFRHRNNSQNPMYLTTFYREGIEYKKRNIDLTEGVLKVYKTGYESNVYLDQVKLIKMRRINNQQRSDTIFPKMKSGISSCLHLDVVKNLPDFVDVGVGSLYTYTHTDITVVEDRRVNVISFEQKASIKEPSLYKGQLLIDAENSALLEAHFELDPRYIGRATNFFVEKKDSKLKLTLQQAKYVVSYKQGNDGMYYINHIRGDIHFRVKKKRHLFSNDLNFWFEMVTCKVENENVKGFSRKERLSSNKIFSETKYQYDRNFWENFNIILPEEPLEEFIINNLSEVIVGYSE